MRVPRPDGRAHAPEFDGFVPQKSFLQTEVVSRAEARVYSFLVKVHAKPINRRKLGVRNSARVYWLGNAELSKLAHGNFANESLGPLKAKCDQLVFRLSRRLLPTHASSRKRPSDEILEKAASGCRKQPPARCEQALTVIDPSCFGPLLTYQRIRPGAWRWVFFAEQ